MKKPRLKVSTLVKSRYDCHHYFHIHRVAEKKVKQNKQLGEDTYEFELPENIAGKHNTF